MGNWGTEAPATDESGTLSHLDANYDQLLHDMGEAAGPGRGAEGVVQVRVEPEQLRVDVGGLPIGLIDMVLESDHLVLSRLDGAIGAADHRPEDRGTQGAGLSRT